MTPSAIEPGRRRGDRPARPSRGGTRPPPATVPLPAARSRAALGLAVGAAEGRFMLQVCGDCGAVQYPPRDVCGTACPAR